MPPRSLRLSPAFLPSNGFGFLPFQLISQTFSRLLPASLLFALVCFCVQGSASAEVLFWDGSGVTWGDATAWSTLSGATSPDPAAAPGLGDDVVFGLSEQTVSMGSLNQQANSLLFTGAGATSILSGGGAVLLTTGTGGIRVGPGAGPVVIGAANLDSIGIALNGDQVWANDSLNLLTIQNGIAPVATSGLTTLTISGTGIGGINLNGGLSDNGGGALQLTVAAPNSVTQLAGASNYSGGTVVSTGTLRLATNASITAGGSLFVGRDSGDNGSFVLSGTYSSGGYVSIGENAGASGTMTVNGGQMTNGYMIVGQSGTGTLNITNGSVSVGSWAAFGNNAGATGSVAMSGGSLSLPYIYAGCNGGVADFNISGGTLSSSASTWIGYTSGASATMSSGTWSNTNLVIGAWGPGTLSQSGGTITGNSVTVGDSAPGSATVSGGSLSGSTMSVGNNSNGTLTLAGGVVTVGSGTLELGVNGGSSGTLNLGNGGAVGTLNASTIHGGAGTAVVNFNPGGSYTFTPSLQGSLSVNVLGGGNTTLTGTHNYTGDTSVESGTLTLGSSGVITPGGSLFVGRYNGDNGNFVLSGTYSSGGYVSIGENAGARGTMTINGGQMTNGNMIVGQSGTGALNITNGSVSVGSWAAFGNSAGASGSVGISGGSLSIPYIYAGCNGGVADFNLSGGTLSSSVFTWIGYSSGASVTMTSGTWSNNNLFIGAQGNGTLSQSGGAITGTAVTIGDSGPGSATITGGSLSGSTLSVGNNSSGTLTLAGGSVTVGSGTLELGVNAGSSGTLNLGNGGAVGALNASTIHGGAGTAVVNFNQFGLYQFTPILAGNLSVNVMGSGTTVLGTQSIVLDKNSFTGGTTVNNGALKIIGAHALGNPSGQALALTSGTVDFATDLLNLYNIASSGTSALYSDRYTSGAGSTHTFANLALGSGLLNIRAGSNVTSGTAVVTLNAVTLSGGAGSVCGLDTALGASLSLGAVYGNGQTLTLQGTGTTAVTGAIATGAGGLIKNGSGSALLNASNSFSGGLTVNAGQLYLNNTGALNPATPNDVTINGGTLLLPAASLSIGNLAGTGGKITNQGVTGSSVLTLIQTGTTSFSGTIADGNGMSTSLTLTGGGQLNLLGASSYSGTTTIQNGTLNFGANGALNSGATLVAGAVAGDNGAISIAGGSLDAASITLGASLGASGALSINGGYPDTQASYLSAGYLGSGTVNVNNGTLRTQTASLGTGTSGVGTANMNGGYWYIPQGFYIGDGGTGVLNVSGGNLNSGNTYLGYYQGSNATVSVSNGTWTNTTISVNSAANLNISGGWVATQSLGILGQYANTSGTANVTGGAWTGPEIDIGSYGYGTLNVSGGNVNGNNQLVVGYYSGGNGVVNAIGGSLNGPLYLGWGGTGQLNLTGGHVSSSLTELGGLTYGQGIASATSGVWDTGALYNGYQGRGYISIDGALVNSAQSYVGNQGGNSYGSVTITSGTWNSGGLQIGNGDMAINGGVVNSGTTLVSTQNTGMGSITVNGGTWNVDYLEVGDATAAQMVLSSGTVNVEGGTGTLWLSTHIPYTQIGATLSFGAGGSAGTLNASSIIANSAWSEVDFKHSGEFTLGAQIQGLISLRKEGDGTTILTGSNSFYGDVYLTSGTLSLANPSALGTSGTLYMNGGVLQYTSQNQADYSSRFDQNSGSALNIDTNGQSVSFVSNLTSGSNRSLTKFGEGTLSLYGSNSFTGGVNLQGGNLRVGNTAALGSSGTIGFNGGILQYSVYNATDYSGRFSTASNQSFQIDTAGRVVGFATGLSSANGSLGKLGDGTLFLYGNNSYSGPTTVRAGTLALSGSTDAGNGALVAGSLAGDDGAITVSGAFTSTGNLVLGNAAGARGTLNLSGGNVSLGNTGFNAIGLSGTGSLNLNGGGLSSSGFDYLGYNGGSLGTATVNSGTWSHSNLIVGEFGSGTVTLNGGTISSSSYTTIGEWAGSNGTVNLNGGTWSCPWLYVGWAGTGTVNYAGGSLVGGLYLNVAGNYGSVGTVAVSSGTFANSSIDLGVAGNGTLNLTGGIVNTDTLVGASNATGVALINVSGGVLNANQMTLGQGGAGTLTLSSGTVTVGSGSGTLNLAANPGAIGTLNIGSGILNAAAVNGGNGVATVNFTTSGTYQFTPVLSGNLAANITGGGTVILSATNTHSGTTTVSSGRLVVGGALAGKVVGMPGSEVASANNDSASMGDVSVLSDASQGGSLSPGGDTGDMGGIGTMTIHGDLNLGTAGSTALAQLKMQLGGTTAGTAGYDQIIVNGGSINLANIDLVGSLFGFIPREAILNQATQKIALDGDMFFLVIGASGVNGGFANQQAPDPLLAGFNTISFGGQDFAISYSANWNGGTNSTFTGGNDIALMAIPEPSIGLLVVAGAGFLQFGLRRRKHS